MASFMRCDICSNEERYRMGRISVTNRNGTRVIHRDICEECIEKLLSHFFPEERR